MSEPTVGAAVLRPLRSGNAFEECVGRLLQLVRLGLVLPGERLPPERELAGRLAVSRATLREALRALAEAGWVAARPGRYGGSFVLDAPAPAVVAAPPTPAELADVLAVRRVVEVGAVELAASSPVPAAAAAALDQMVRDCRSAAPHRYRPLDSRLHLALVELAGSPSLSAVAADVRMRLNDLLDRIPLLPRNIAHSDAQHQRIVDAVVRGRPPAARRAVEEHLAASAALLHGFLG